LALAAAGLLAGVLGATSPVVAKDKAVEDSLSKLLTSAQGRIAAGQADSAFALLRRRLLEEVQAMATSPPHPLDDRLTRGLVLTAEAAGKPWEGMSAILAVLPLRPSEPRLHIALGELELGRGRLEPAIRHFERALLLDDHEVDALGGFGQARGTLGGIEPGKQYFNQLIQARPQEPAARFGKGMMLLESGAVDEALSDLSWAIGLDAGEWRFNRAYARARARQGKVDEATKAYQQAIRALKQSGDPLMAERVALELGALKAGKS
jgi:tetratricopeptide (TPR) repeat protein